MVSARVNGLQMSVCLSIRVRPQCGLPVCGAWDTVLVPSGTSRLGASWPGGLSLGPLNAGDLLGPPLFQHSSSLLRRAAHPLAADGDSLEMPSSRMHGGITGCTRQVWNWNVGKIWTPSSSPAVHGRGSCIAPLLPLALLVLLLAQSKRCFLGCSWGYPKDNIMLGGVVRSPSSTGCSEGGL